jgi:coatomer subunit beta'
MYLLGYMVTDNRIYVCDKDLKLYSWTLLLPVLEYQTYIIANNMEAANALLPKIPDSEKSKLARFLEARGLKQLALEVTTDPDQRFELALALGDLNMALNLAQSNGSDSQWRMIGERAELEWRGDIAIACCRNAKDWAGLMLWGVASGDPGLIREAALGAGTTINFSLIDEIY